MRLAVARLRRIPIDIRTARSRWTLLAAYAGHRRSQSQPMRGSLARPAVPPVDPQGERGTESLILGYGHNLLDRGDTQPKIQPGRHTGRDA